MSPDRLPSKFEIIRVPVTPEDPSFVESCKADLHFPNFADINIAQLASLGAAHVLLDVDGTLIARNGRGLSIDEPTAEKLREISEGTEFKTVSLATENMAHPDDLLQAMGLTAASNVFQPFEAGKLGMSWKTTNPFWRKILFHLDCLDNPEDVVMIGDSPARDIQPAQEHGLKTVLVDRLEQRCLPLLPLIEAGKVE